IHPMDAVADFLRRMPDEIGRVGGSLPWRVGLLVIALLLNIGFYLPAVPEGAPGAGVPGIDKAVHRLVFAPTGFAAGRLLAARRGFPSGGVVLAALAQALLIELVQLALPQRGVDGADVLFGVIGIALGLGLWVGERVLRGAAREREAGPSPSLAQHRD